MGRIVQRTTVTKKVSRNKKIPAGYHRCPNCGGDGICKSRTKRRKRN